MKRADFKKYTSICQSHIMVVNPEGKSWPQILAIVIGSVASLTSGLMFSWTSPSILRITKDHDTYDIDTDEASYFTVLPPIGMMVSSLVFPKLNDSFGRKKTLMLVVIPQMISWVLIATARSVYVFYVARFLVGISDGCIYSALPMYIGEISTPSIRGSWGNTFTFTVYFGQFLINVIGSYFGIAETAYICMAAPIIFVVGFYFMPESPYFYLMHGREAEARKSLQFLRHIENVDHPLEAMKKDVERQMSESGSWKDLFTIQSNRRAVYAAVFLRASQQVAGISSIAVYLQFIFEKAGGNLSKELSSMIFFGLATGLNLCAGVTLDKLGRKKSYLISLVACGFTMFVLSAYLYVDVYEPEIDVQFLNWIPITALIGYVIFYSFGLGIVPTLMLGELFSASIKGKALCLMSLVCGVLTSSVTKLFHVLDSQIGLFAPFLFFGICCAISTVLSLYLVPETKGKTLEEIQQAFKSSKKKKSLKGDDAC